MFDVEKVRKGLVKTGNDPEAEKYYRQVCQAAIKDINETILKPDGVKAISPIMAHEKFAEAITGAIAPLVGTDADGTPTWKNERAGNLKPETVELYNFLTDDNQQEALGQAAATGGEAVAQAKPKPKPKSDSYSRVDSIVQVLKDNVDKPMSKKELADATHRLYVKKGGADNHKIAVRALDQVIVPMVKLGHIVEQEDGKMTYRGA